MLTLNQIVSSALATAEREILQSAVSAAMGWNPVFDEFGNPNVPSDEREVLVFLSGDIPLTTPRSGDQGWGIRFGYFDHDRHQWRVNGIINTYVTHWMDLPMGPESSR